MRISRLLVLLPLAAAAPVQAAESYDACAGFVTSVPATIGTQGVWCLNKDVAMSLTSGAAITIGTNNVTLDCNGFRIGGLAAGDGTDAIGILADDVKNSVIRRCTVRGFRQGILLAGGSGHVVEDNRLEGNTDTGINAAAEDSTIRRNRIVDTGGRPDYDVAQALFVTNDTHVLDNIVSGVAPTGEDGGTGPQGIAYGILTSGADASSVSGNRISGLVPAGEEDAYGIHHIASTRVQMADNHVVGPAGVGVGITCSNAQGLEVDNLVVGFADDVAGCTTGAID